MDEVSQLKTILKNSFSGIKKDISELKEKQEESLATGYKLKQDVEKIKDDYVSKDKLNVLKIKVGEINDTLKKLWDLDSSIKKVDEKKADQKEFETRFERLKEEIAKQLSDLNSGTTRKIIEYTNAVNRHIEDVNNNSAKVFSKINEQMKVVVTKNQLKSLTSELNDEFASLKKEVVELRKIKETITASELEKRTNLINARVDLLAKEVLKTNQNLSQCTTSEQVKSIVGEINHEFNELKMSASELAKLKQYVKLVESEALTKKEFARQLSAVNSEIDSSNKEIRALKSELATKKELDRQAAEINSSINDAKKEIAELRSNSKAYARHEDIEKNMDRIESLLTRKILDIEKEVLALKRFERRYDKNAVAELKKEDRQSKKEMKLEKTEKEARAEISARPGLKKEARPRKPYFALSVVSITLIVLAFASLGAAIAAFFTFEQFTNYLTIGAVVLFVMGIVMRAILIKKRK